MDLSSLVISKRVAGNATGRDFVVADLHGCYSSLMQAMEAVAFDVGRDRLFALGDLIDRGDECFECLSLLKQPWFHSVLGNHEYMMLSALSNGMASTEWRAWMQNGGFWFKQLDQEQYQSVKSLLSVLIDLPVAITLELDDERRVGLCHAQPPSNDWQWFVEHPAPDTEFIVNALWGRDVIRAELPIKIQGVDATFHGHTIVSSPTTLGNMHFIDTGAYLGNQIKLVELNDELIRGEVKAA